MMHFHDRGVQFWRRFCEREWDVRPGGTARLVASESLGDRDDEAELVARWRRARALGARPLGGDPIVAVPDQDLVERKERLAPVTARFQRLFAPLEDALARASAIALFADPEGVILSTKGWRTVDSPTTRARLVDGCSWSEKDRGTNAIGTAAIERVPVSVVGAAHFEARNHALFCHAAPVLDLFGEVVGVVDVSGPLGASDAAFSAAVPMAARALEEALAHDLFARTIAGGLPAVEARIGNDREATLVVDGRGQVVARNVAFCMLFGLSPEEPLTVERLFGTRFDAVAKYARDSQVPLAFEVADRRLAVSLEPLQDARNRVFAVIIRFRDRAFRQEIVRARPSPTRPASFARVHGSDPALAATLDKAARIAASTLPVLLIAETGTGKERLAAAIHGASPRASSPFVAVNCAAVPASLLESELFGHAPRSFTGASRSGSKGKIAEADGGTLFLDELGDMPAAMQAALLRVLEDGSYYRVGEERPRKSQFRLIAATGVPLADAVAAGTFRADLYHRLAGAVLAIPPLRDRRDLPELATAILGELAPPGTEPKHLSHAALARLTRHTFPGNIRELRMALHHAVVLAGERERIDVEDLPDTLQPGGTSLGSKVRRVVDDVMGRALDNYGGNVSEAARRLGVSRSTLYRRGLIPTDRRSGGDGSE